MSEQLLLSRSELKMINAIVELKKERENIKKVDLADYLGKSRANVTQIIKKLQEKNIVVVDDKGFLGINDANEITDNTNSVFGFSARKARTYKNYLNAIKELSTELDEVKAIDVRKSLGFNTASVSVYLHEMEDAGLIEYDENKRITIRTRGLELIRESEGNADIGIMDLVQDVYGKSNDTCTVDIETNIDESRNNSDGKYDANTHTEIESVSVNDGLDEWESDNHELTNDEVVMPVKAYVGNEPFAFISYSHRNMQFIYCNDVK